MGMGSYKSLLWSLKRREGEKEKRTEKPQKKGQTGVWRENWSSLFIYDPVYSRPSNGYYTIAHFLVVKLFLSRLPDSVTHVPRQVAFSLSPPLPAPVPPLLFSP